MTEIKSHFLQIVLTLILGHDTDPLVVNSLEDLHNPPHGIVTIRKALENAESGDIITFAEDLNGGVINLSIVGEEHSILKGEVMGMRDEPSGPVSYLVGYFDRDYGRSALYAHKNVSIDASNLPDGVTLEWTGGAANTARVLAIYGDLTLNNIRITGGYNAFEDISESNAEQPFTLSRGCGVAVWGVANIKNSEIYNNHCIGDFGESRDRGAFGGGLYANIVDIDNSVVSGNSVQGAGAAGGGVYSVGGALTSLGTSTINRSSITGNLISAIFTYGGGVYSDGGGIGNLKNLSIINSTIARNRVNPVQLPDQLTGLYNMGYWRGGGIYMSNGYLKVTGSTVVENEVYGYKRTDTLGKSNLAGGIAATIGNAHAVEEMVIGQSIITGNTISELGSGGLIVATNDHDIFTGSLLHFKSNGYNLIGTIDFSQILVPVGVENWKSLSRKHYPMVGDEHGVNVGDVLDLTEGVFTSDHINSSFSDPPSAAVLFYQAQGQAIDKIPSTYSVDNYYYEYIVANGGVDNFLEILLGRIERTYNLIDFADSVKNEFEEFLVDVDDVTPGNQQYKDDVDNPILTLSDTQWFGPVATWPSNIANYAYIEFYHFLDNELRSENIPVMGPELLGDASWRELFDSGIIAENPDITIIEINDTVPVYLLENDQLGNSRPVNQLGDIGAIEVTGN